MAVDGVGGSRQTERLDQARRSSETQKTGAFQALMKGERSKTDGKDLKKGPERSEKKDEKAEAKRAASDQSMLDEILGRGRIDGAAVEGRSGDGAGGGASGEGGGEKDGDMSVTGKSGRGGVEGAEEGDGKVAGKGGGQFGEKLRGKMDKKGAESARGEAGVKAAKGEKGEKAEKTAEGEAAPKTGKGEAAEKSGKGEAAEKSGKGEAAEKSGKGEAAEKSGKGEAGAKAGKGEAAEKTGKGEAAEKSGKGEAAEKTGKGEAAEKTGKGEAAEKTGKGEAAEKKAGVEGGERADAKGKLAGGDGREVASKETARADQAKALDSLRKGDRAADGKSGSTKTDDGKTLQEQIARNMFPGEVPHPFLMQQIDAVQQVQAAQPVIPPEIVDRIVAQARFGTNVEGAQEFQIQLKDDVFKGAELKVSTKDGKVTIEFVAKDAESAATFEQKAQEITKQLTDKGLNVTSVSVTMAPQGGSQDAAGGQSKGKDQQQRDRGVGGVGGAGRGAGAAAARAAADSASGLDSGGRTGKDYTA